MALAVEDLTDEMIEQAISGATTVCPKCGETILRGCGRHLKARHPETDADHLGALAQS